MEKERIKLQSIIFVIICAVLAGGLIFMVRTKEQKGEAQSAAIEAVMEEAAPYEKELQELEKELSDMEEQVSYSSEEAKILVGFVAEDAADLAYMEEKAEAYDFPPVVVLDCTMEMDVIEEIVEEMDGLWEIMLFAPTFSEEINEDVLSVISYLESVGAEHTGVFFLRSDYCTDANIQLLLDDGFIGCTSYNEKSPESGQTEDGLVYIDYSYLSSSGTSVSTRISAMYSNKASMIFALNMESINAGKLSENYVNSLLEKLQDYTEKDDCSFSTVEAAVEELSAINSTEAGNQASFEEESAKIRERIAELEEIIDEIYNAQER